MIIPGLGYCQHTRSRSLYQDWVTVNIPDQGDYTGIGLLSTYQIKIRVKTIKRLGQLFSLCCDSTQLVKAHHDHNPQLIKCDFGTDEKDTSVCCLPSRNKPSVCACVLIHVVTSYKRNILYCTHVSVCGCAYVCVCACVCVPNSHAVAEQLTDLSVAID